MAYSSKSFSSNKSGSNNSSSEQKSSTTHYAYTLVRDADGNVTGKDYVNNLAIFENEGKYGSFLKVKVNGPIPSGDLFIVKKRTDK